MNFIPPTNQASSIHACLLSSKCPVMSTTVNNDSAYSEKLSNSLSSLPMNHSPCLPVSKGCIKKMAQTRFVNSSPRSYRLMPASIESKDRTSFVEKSPHKQDLPLTFMIDVAELWRLSKHSELDCMFTVANTGYGSSTRSVFDESRQRSPICHTCIVPGRPLKQRLHINSNVPSQEMSSVPSAPL